MLYYLINGASYMTLFILEDMCWGLYLEFKYIPIFMGNKIFKKPIV